jgi:V-type H+-transporting ATPase subunit d
MRRQYNLGSLATFSVEHAFLDGVLRGLRSGFISSREYVQLCQCNNLADFKLALGDTDYCSILSNVNDLTEDIIYKKCQDKFVAEFEYLRGQAVGPASTFLDFITYLPMIENISFIVSSLIKRSNSGEDVVPAELLAKCPHPLGMDPHLKLLFAFEPGGDGKDNGLVELYSTVLIDTPVARYFSTYFAGAVSGSDRGQGAFASMSKEYEEREFEVITEEIKKLCMEDFFDYTQQLGGETSEAMRNILEWEADSRAINITINSFNSDLNKPAQREDDRKRLYCNFGQLYPNATLGLSQDASSFMKTTGVSAPSFSRVSDQASLEQALQPYIIYHNLYQVANESKSLVDDRKTFLDVMNEHEVRMLTRLFDGQSHLACFYAWYKLKMYELRNLKWILGCIAQGASSKRKSQRITHINFCLEGEKSQR